MAECVERMTGMDFRDYLRSRVLDPSGLDSFFVGMPEDVQRLYSIADNVAGNPANEEQRKEMELANSSDDLSKKPMGQFGTPEVRALGVPGAGGLVTAADLALLYQPLVNGGKVWGGGQILQPETIDLATTPHTDVRHFSVFGSIASPAEVPGYTEAGLETLPKLRGIVVELAGGDEFAFPAGEDSDLPQMYKGFAGKTVPGKLGRQGQFGASNSARAFGHDGAIGQIGWGDPETGISLGFVTNTADMQMRMNGWDRGSEIANLANMCTIEETAKL